MTNLENRKVVDLWGDQPPAEPHRKVLSDLHRFIVLVAGRKFRKTSISMTKLIKGAMTHPLTYPYILPYRKQAKEVLWYDHVPRILNLFKENGIPYKKNDSELFIQFPFSGGRFKLDGSDNSEALRGIGNWGGFALGEYSDWKKDVWEQIIRPNLITTKAWGIFEGTPKGYNQLHRLAKIGDHQGIIEGEIYDENGKKLLPEQYLDKDFNTWRFTSYDNPYLDREEIESAKRQSTKEFFDQEYMAKFTKYTGLVFKEFQREVHVIEPFDIPESWSIYRSFDWGDTNPTVCLWIAIDNDENWFILNEHYEPLHGHGYDYLAGVVNANPFSKRITSSYADPSDPTAITELSLKGIYITPANKEVGTNFNSWVRFGIEKVAERLKRIPGHITNVNRGGPDNGLSEKGEPSLYIFGNCTNIIREFETYRWKEKSVSQAQDLNEPDVPEKANDHCFTGDTMILTKTGWKRIDRIKKGEYVWSPFGWNEVYRAGYTGKKKIKDYGVFKCTLDHKILTTRGLVEVDKLRYSDIIMVWLNTRPFTFKEFLIGAIQTPKTELIGFTFNALLIKSLMARQDFYIEKYGNTTMVKFLMAIWFTILTGILGITTLAILSLSLLRNTLKSITGAFGKDQKNIWTGLDILQLDGMARQAERRLTLALLGRHGELKNGFLRIVRFAGSYIKLPFLVEANTVIRTARRQRGVEKRVYNLATKFGCYFANGILVSNSMDALRYFAVSYKKQDNDMDLPDDTDKFQGGFY